METYTALIAMRGGSKRFPGKHLAKASPAFQLCELAVIKCRQVANLKDIYVATDEQPVLEILKQQPVKFFKRTRQTATDSARVETCVREFLNHYPSIKNLIFFPGANASWVTPVLIQQAIEQYERTNANSLITVSPLKRYLYARDLNGWIDPLTIDTYRRGFLGNLPPVWIENGSFYIFNTKKFLETDSFRIEPCTGFVMEKEAERELDTPTDLAVINAVKSLQ